MTATTELCVCVYAWMSWPMHGRSPMTTSSGRITAKGS